MRRFKSYPLAILILCAPLLLRAAQFEVKVIRSAADLPEPFTSLAKEGDILVADGRSLVLFGGTDRVLRSYYQYPIEHTLGSVLGYVPRGKGLKGELVFGSPYIRIKERSRYLGYSSFTPVPRNVQSGPLQFLAVAHYEGDGGEKAEVRTLYHLDPDSGAIQITATVKNTGEVRLEDLHYSLYGNPGQRYSFSPLENTAPDGSSGPSPGRTGFPFWVYPKKGHYLGWIDLNPIQALYQPISWESVSTTLEPGKSLEARYVLLADVEAEDLLRKIYQILGVRAAQARVDIADFDGELMEVVVQDMSSRVFFRSFLENPRPLALMLPPGSYSVRANFFPAVVESPLAVEAEEENAVLLRDPPQGKIRVSIRNSAGAYVPGKTTFFGLAPTRTPYFRPENPLETNNYHEETKNSRFPREEGLEVDLPVGTYLISASRGPEYSLDQRVVAVHEGSRQDLVFRIDKVVETPGLISVDPHLHTLNSDGSVTIAERIRSVAAEGVDVAISTDHNVLSDYPSGLRTLGLDAHISVLVGQEVSALDVNERYMPEFNRFPLERREGEPGNGALDIAFFENNAPLFGESRKRDPGALIQVNHPRGVESYFTYYQLDPDTAATALKGFDTSFDLLEVMNGPSFRPSNQRVVQDWLHLLNRGCYFPIVGSSDSHGIDGEEPGYARTYVNYEGKKGPDIDVRALTIALKNGRSFVSNGPIVEFTVNSRHVPGDLLTVKNGRVEVRVRVQAAPWISVDEVRVIVNGERTGRFQVNAPREHILRFQNELALDLERDSYIAIEVLGGDTLFPVVKSRSDADGRAYGPLPYALTNPIFVDMDGNGRFDPPLPGIRLIPQ